MTKKLFVVDTIVTFRHRYAVECENLEDAYQIVSNNGSVDAEYFESVTQRCLGESIIDGRKITKSEFNSMIKELKDNENELCSHWMGDKLIHKVT